MRTEMNLSWSEFSALVRSTAGASESKPEVWADFKKQFSKFNALLNERNRLKRNNDTLDTKRRKTVETLLREAWTDLLRALARIRTSNENG